MEEKKKVIIIATIALILAITAISLSLSDSSEVPTTGNMIKENQAGEIGIVISPAAVEDKLANQESEGSS